ncbi:hypothetical protein EDC01DRAFT_636051 [Geopyxis carbonaria]|nr:hypothetical protein EDC01DRAFT_636051 [Geopyxis carbonaria]
MPGCFHNAIIFFLSSSNFTFCQHCNQLLPYTSSGTHTNLPHSYLGNSQQIAVSGGLHTTGNSPYEHNQFSIGTSHHTTPSTMPVSTGMSTPLATAGSSFSSIKGLQHAVGQAMRGPKALNALPVGQGKPTRKNKGRIPSNHNTNSSSNKPMPPLLNSPTLTTEHRYEVSLITSNSGDSRDCLEHPGTELWEPSEETLNIPVDNSNWPSFLRIQLLGSLGLWREFKDEWYQHTEEIQTDIHWKGPSRMPNSMLQQPELVRNLLEKHFRPTRQAVIPAMVIWVQHVPLQEQLEQIAVSDAQYLEEAQARQANKNSNESSLNHARKSCLTGPTTLQELEALRNEQDEQESLELIPDVNLEWDQTEDSSDSLSTVPNTPPPIKQKKRSHAQIISSSPRPQSRAQQSPEYKRTASGSYGTTRYSLRGATVEKTSVVGGTGDAGPELWYKFALLRSLFGWGHCAPLSTMCPAECPSNPIQTGDAVPELWYKFALLRSLFGWGHCAPWSTMCPAECPSNPI